MPMYEYVCMKCEEHFEELVRSDEDVTCPQCGTTNVSRQLSTFAMIGTAGQTGALGGGGGGCCGGGRGGGPRSPRASRRRRPRPPGRPRPRGARRRPSAPGVPPPPPCCP